MIIKSLKKKEIIKKLLNFLYLIRYLITIILISILVIFFSPNFFDFNDNLSDLNKVLSQNNINVKKVKNISYDPIPIPSLIIEKAEILINKNSDPVLVDRLYLKINLLGAYRLDKIKIKKIKFENFNLKLNKKRFKEFISFINKNNDKIEYNNFEIFLANKDINFLKIDKIFLKNINKNKIHFKGLIADKNFKGSFTFDKKNNLKLKIKDLGINLDLLFKEDTSLLKPSGLMKLKVLENNIIMNFSQKEKFYISNSLIKSKNFSLSYDGSIIFDPFFNFNLTSNIKKLNYKKIQIDNVLSNLINKKINGRLSLQFDKNIIFKKYLYDNFFILINFVNGNLNASSSKILLKGGDLKFDINYNDNQNIKKVEFNITLKIENKKEIYKKFKIQKIKDMKNESFKIIGFLNLSAKKIYFDEILIDKKKKLSDKELKILKQKFEKIFFNLNSTRLKMHDFKELFFEYIEAI